MKRYKMISLITVCLAVYHANKGDVAFTVFYCFCLHWFRDWMIREDGDKDGS